MKCPKCQFDNPEGIKFCGDCGSKLEVRCPHCKSPNPPQFKFCGECGQKLSIHTEASPKELSFDEKLEKIQRYLPKGLTEKILSQRNKIEGERKQVTVMFCDMEGFTSLSERISPEEAYTIMDKIYEILIYKVHDYEGTVNEMTGDGVLAFFGAPIALEDAPQRAIRSAFAIHREMVKFSDRIGEDRQLQRIRMRIGIHTGPVVVGTLGNDLRVEFKAVGDTVNLASRIEQLADPGATYVSEDTFKLTEGFFRFEALGDKKVKGKEKPVKIYRAVTARNRKTRFDVSAERGLSPFLGRERELEILLDAFERSKHGRGQAVSIIAEAGVGKSRLLYEFRKSVANEDVTFLEGKCLSYSRDIAYHPVIDILKSTYGIQEDDDDLVVREKVVKGLKMVGADVASTLPFLLELLSVKETELEEFSLSPEAKKTRIIEALNINVLKGSEKRPIVMATEDLHWVDRSSEERIKSLLDCISGARILLIFTYRPEFIPIWSAKSYHSQINLNRLSNRESLTMVAHLLGSEEIDKDLADLIIEKTEGVPFFIEEFVKSITEQKVIDDQRKRYHIGKDIKRILVPSTIQDVIMSRVDSLPDGVKRILQSAAVMGREFDRDLIQSVTGIPNQKLMSYLSVLKDSELLYERGVYPDSSYIFKHALTQEVVYNSLLSKRKKEIHEMIGEAIESLYSQRLDESYEILAYHYSNSASSEKAIYFLEMAGDKAGRVHSLQEARQHYRKALSFFQNEKKSRENKQKYIDLTLKWAEVSQYAPSDMIKEALKLSLQYAQELESKESIAEVSYWIGRFSYMQGVFNEALPQIERCIKWAKDFDNQKLLALSYNLIGRSCWYTGEYAAGLKYLKDGLGLIEPYKIWDDIVYSGGILGLIQCSVGHFDQSIKTIENAIQTAKDHKILTFEAMLFGYLGAVQYWYGDWKEAIKNCSKCIDSSKRLGNLLPIAWGSLFKGAVLFNTGKQLDGLTLMKEAIQILLGANSVLALRFFYSLLAEYLSINEDYTEAETVNEKAMALGKFGQRWGEIANYRTMALLAAADFHPDLTLMNRYVEKSIQLAKEKGALCELVISYYRFSDMLDRIGDRERSKSYRHQGQMLAKKIGFQSQTGFQS